ncbi:MAG: dihydroorotase, partial [Salinisphaera sp.]|nr:dihydroorotase [Salinisphaera sp.]
PPQRTPMADLLIPNANLVNEGSVRAADLLVRNGRIHQIAGQITAPAAARVIDAAGRHLLPGMMDDQVHFREPGLTHKADIAHESAAAVAGGITSYMEMPNVDPPTIDTAALDAKKATAAKKSRANYGFYLGATNDNIAAIRALDPRAAPGIKVFMGASTGNMLVDNDNALHAIFRDAAVPILTHCEDTPTIHANEAAARARFGEDVPMSEHPHIRSEEACYASSSKAVGLAREHGSDLHVIHITSARELALFSTGPVSDKRITAEACVHHLYFDEGDYAEKGSLIKCNPAIKTAADREALLAAVLADRIDVIATDHAPHLLEEKNRPYFQAPAGLPLVQHALLTLLEQVQRGIFSLELVAHKTAHAVAERFSILDRGYLREGYWADLVLIDMETPTIVDEWPLLSKCGWSPFAGHRFPASIVATVVSGQVAYDDGKVSQGCIGLGLEFSR